MPRYIDADKIVFWIRRVSSDGLNVDVRRIAFSDEIGRIPTADVVPKSEYDEVLSNWQKIHDSYTADCIEHYNKGCQKVAREIFDDIANIIVLQHGFNEKHIVAHIDFELLKELNKKYTGEKENEV